MIFVLDFKETTNENGLFGQAGRFFFRAAALQALPQLTP